VSTFLVGFGAGVAATLVALAAWRWLARLPSSLAP
jgi:hypothetical protein